MSEAPRYEPSPDVLVSHLQDEAVLLHMGTKNYFRLNRVGAEIWKLLEAGTGTDAIVENLVATFDVSDADAGASVLGLMDDLVRNTLVRVVV